MGALYTRGVGLGVWLVTAVCVGKGVELGLGVGVLDGLGVIVGLGVRLAPGVGVRPGRLQLASTRGITIDREKRRFFFIPTAAHRTTSVLNCSITWIYPLDVRL